MEVTAAEMIDDSDVEDIKDMMNDIADKIDMIDKQGLQDRRDDKRADKEDGNAVESDLEERTLAVREMDSNAVTESVLAELMSNFGPVINVVFRKDHAFVEFNDRESVAYALAMVEGVSINGCQLKCAPKLTDDDFYYRYVKEMHRFENDIFRPRNQFRYLKAHHQKSIGWHRDTPQFSFPKKSLTFRGRLYARHYPLIKGKMNPYLGWRIVGERQRPFFPKESNSPGGRFRSPDRNNNRQEDTPRPVNGHKRNASPRGKRRSSSGSKDDAFFRHPNRYSPEHPTRILSERYSPEDPAWDPTDASNRYSPEFPTRVLSEPSSRCVPESSDRYSPEYPTRVLPESPGRYSPEYHVPPGPLPTIRYSLEYQARIPVEPPGRFSPPYPTRIPVEHPSRRLPPSPGRFPFSGVHPVQRRTPPRPRLPVHYRLGSPVRSPVRPGPSRSPNRPRIPIHHRLSEPPRPCPSPKRPRLRDLDEMPPTRRCPSPKRARYRHLDEPPRPCPSPERPRHRLLGGPPRRLLSPERGINDAPRYYPGRFLDHDSSSGSSSPRRMSHPGFYPGPPPSPPRTRQPDHYSRDCPSPNRARFACRHPADHPGRYQSRLPERHRPGPYPAPIYPPPYERVPGAWMSGIPRHSFEHYSKYGYPIVHRYPEPRPTIDNGDVYEERPPTPRSNEYEPYMI